MQAFLSPVPARALARGTSLALRGTSARRPRHVATRACASAAPPPAGTAPAEAAAAEARGSGAGGRLRALSGVQPTGALHLGNYLGAVRGWAAGQDDVEGYFFVVDLHALTVPQEGAALRAATLDSVAMYLAAGLDPERSTVFVQSHVRAHAELAWLLNCVTPMGWLERMIQFKEKARKGGGGGSASVGLFDYPVLQAADVLLYQADVVPVGEDQRQHIELARDIARRYNDMFCKPLGRKAAKARGLRRGAVLRTLKEPRAVVTETARVMSLQDGTSKMSKSDENDLSRINMTDADDVIARKVKRCKTDAVEGLEIGNPDRPECTNLLRMYAAVTGMAEEDVLRECGGLRWGEFKPRLSDALVAHIGPVRDRFLEIRDDPAYVHDVLRMGYETANATAEETLDRVKADMGLVLPRDVGISL